MKITILTDNKDSWFVPYGRQLVKDLKSYHDVKYVFNKTKIRKGDVCFILSCSRLIQQKYLDLNKNNIVVHASDLPRGKGFAPFSWQILKGNKKIHLTLFEAVKNVDAGPYYMKGAVKYEGHELLLEMQIILAKKIIEMCIEYVKKRDELKPINQIGRSSYFSKRTPEDSELDINKTIKNQFNLLRIVDNNRYPAFFKFRGKKYLFKIEKSKND